MRWIIIPNVKIAVIDEDPIVRDFVVNTLMYSVNREILTFDNGFDAYTTFTEAGPPDIVVADINLHEIDGVTLLSKIKELNIHTKVILISDLPEKEAIARDKGADAFLAKPFGVNELFHIVQTYVVDGEPVADTPTTHDAQPG